MTGTADDGLVENLQPCRSTVRAGRQLNVAARRHPFGIVSTSWVGGRMFLGAPSRSSTVARETS
jgi:hypothetical protein